MRVLPRFSLSTPTENLAAEKLLVFPPPSSQSESRDHFGNRVLQVQHERIEREFILKLEFRASLQPHSYAYDTQHLGEWKMPSRAVSFSPDFLEIARQFRRHNARERAQKLNLFVFESLQYFAQNSDKPFNATQVWESKTGTCADFAHVLIALGRAAGMPARYVAGFGPAAGALHAWVELGIEGAWYAFDPTHGRAAEGRYVPVAVGRDFYDCAPHRGMFYGRGARLQLECELHDGT